MLQEVQTGNNISGSHADRLDADIRLLSRLEVLLSEPALPRLHRINKSDSCPTRPTRLLSSAEKDTSLMPIVTHKSKLVVPGFMEE